MRGPLEILGDFYDYHFEYYSQYLFRRILFSEISPDSAIKQTLSYNIFENKDYDNIQNLVPKSTLLGMSLGKNENYEFLNFDEVLKN